MASQSSASPVAVLTTLAQLEALQALSASEGKLLAVFCWASFHSGAAPGGQLDLLFTELAEANPDAIFAKVDAEEVEDVADALEVEEVPFFAFLSGKATLAAVASSEGKVIADTLAGCKGRVVPAPSSSSAAPASAGAPASAAVSLGASPALRARLLGLTQSAHAVLFMKGSPGNPRCKFSRAAIASLDATGVPYGSVDILQDPEAREGLKELGGRQTYPQLWVGGKLLGGGDEITALAAAGDLARAIAAKPVDPTAAPANPAHAKCERIVKSAEVMLFIKGQPDAPRCGFSARIVDILRGQGVPFESFDILSDPEVRQGLKECLGKWPTFPQLFVKGEFAGGLDVIKEMVEEGDEPLREQLGLE